MKRYSAERKAAILKQLFPPFNRPVAEVARQENISDVTLYTWRNQVRDRGQIVPGSQSSPEQWSAEARVAVVAETLTLPEVELSEYCRKKGLFPEQVKAWREACLNGQRPSAKGSSADREEHRRDKKKIRALEKELHRKEKALAEAAALLVLRKKLTAFWDEKNDEEN
jgi:transposase-like protein